MVFPLPNVRNITYTTLCRRPLLVKIDKRQFLDSKQPNPFQNLQRQHPNLSLADEINDFFVSVSEHLPPFQNYQCDNITIGNHTQDYIILPAEIEYQLAHINIHKSIGSGTTLKVGGQN